MQISSAEYIRYVFKEQELLEYGTPIGTSSSNTGMTSNGWSLSISTSLQDACITILCLSASSFLYRHKPAPTRATIGNGYGYVLENQVTHARLLPAESTHSFNYPTLSLLLSLNALESHSLDLGKGWIFNYGGRWALTALRSNNYLTPEPGRGSIKRKLINVLDERGYDSNELDDAWMLTMPSFMGWEDINPLTVYWCYKPGGVEWLTVLEVCFLFDFESAIN